MSIRGQCYFGQKSFQSSFHKVNVPKTNGPFGVKFLSHGSKVGLNDSLLQVNVPFELKSLTYFSLRNKIYLFMLQTFRKTMSSLSHNLITKTCPFIIQRFF